jgi:hypothetical protein
MPKRSSIKRPRDANQLAKFITDVATGAAELPKTDEGKDPLAVALGRRGGLKGGKERAKKLSASRRSEIAKQAAKKRWGSAKQQEEWAVEEARLLRELDAIRKKRAAAELLGATFAPTFPAPPPSEDNKTFAAALEQFVTGTSVPVSKKDLRAALRLAGYDKQDTPQFYTTIKRLKDKGKISVSKDGSVWKP